MLFQCTDGKAQEESYEMSSAAACQEKSLSVTATVGRDSINSLIGWGNVQFPCLNQSYYNPK